ncbi:hypothetical protein [Streptomyces sp. NPDC057115]|uniref:hypothetical protein n=1 Tax=unclassified Streptomyces TaxID=2593676 RepID=UPI00362CD123
MTDRPYTEDDLRAEAARQHATLTEDPDFMGVGEQMDGSYVESTVIDEDPDFQPEGDTWDALAPHDFEAAQRKIHDLINGAADVSEWAVNLGADGLQPNGHTIQLGAKEAGDDDSEMPFVRMHFAFHPTATDDERDRFVMNLTKAIAGHL